jgi:hypothetical protein
VSKPDANQLGSQIKSLLQQSRWNEAIPLLNEWTKRYPRQANGWYWKASCLARMRRLQEALKCARFGQSLAPDDQKISSLLLQLEKALAADKPEPRPASPEPAGQLPTQQHPAQTAAPEVTLVDSGSAPSPAVPPTMVDSSPAQTAAVPPTMVDSPPAQTAAVPQTMVDSPPAQAAAVPPTMVDPPPAQTAAVPPTMADSPPAEAVPATLAESPGPQTPPPTLAEAAGQQPPGISPARTTTAQWSPGEVVDGRYDVRGSARGGMGEVFFVFDRELGIDIAVKTPLPAAMATQAGRSRFFREAEAWIALGLHPNICTAYYVRDLDGLPRLFIEYVDGGTLEEWLQTNPEAPLADKLDLAIQIAAGVHHAHTFAWQDEDGSAQRGVVHRDLKPANVLLGGDLTARVTDFGLVGRGAGDSNGAEPGGAAPLAFPEDRVVCGAP